MSVITIPIKKETTNWDHLTDELECLNARLLRDVRQLRRRGESGQSNYLRGMVLQEQEILAILTGKPDAHGTVHDDEEVCRRLTEVEERLSTPHADRALRAAPALVQLAMLFQLERIEQQCLMLCLAPEIDRGYTKVFAFLQDDITKQQPSVELALKLFCGTLRDRLAARAIFSPNSQLVRNRLLYLEETEDGSGILAQRGLKLDDRIAAFLLETPQLDGRLRDWVEVIAPTVETVQTALPKEVWGHTVRLVEECFADGEAPMRPVIHLYGRQGSGRRAIAESLSRRIGLPLLVADVRRLPSTGRADALWRLGREALLLPAAVFVEHFDDLLQEGRGAELSALLDAIGEFSPLTCLSGTTAWNAHLREQLFISLECPVPGSAERVEIWRRHLGRLSHELREDDFIEIAGRYIFTDGQIRDAVRDAEYRACWESLPPRPLTAAQLSRACRELATPNLGGLARQVKTGFLWSDIVLPENQLAQLREIAAHVKRAPVVLETWGFTRKFPYGRGITALFEGLSGTGKTMAAGIIGAELGLDLYKIDLSSVVSKYIGETEKNLSRIFAEARDSSAILFFDEADALFGKRSEVKDAHDRYANIETAYLLQQMEEYHGIVILATNMKHNLDDAFFRRLRFIIHFPFPNDEERQQIWEKAFPSDAPLDPAVDFRWLARKLKLAGGSIRNISLRAAFLAVERQGVIDMDCLMDAARREIEKTGTFAPVGEFRPRENREDARKAVEVA